MRECKGLCTGRLLIDNIVTINPKTSTPYDEYNRCTVCSDKCEGVFYKKPTGRCICCGADLRRRSRI